VGSADSASPAAPCTNESGIWPLAITVLVVGRGDDGQIDRKGDDRDAGQEDQMGQQISKSAVLDHGVQ